MTEPPRTPPPRPWAVAGALALFAAIAAVWLGLDLRTGAVVVGLTFAIAYTAAQMTAKPPR
jgi:hypothetical protein